jgi:predicted membrane protein
MNEQFQKTSSRFNDRTLLGVLIIGVAVLLLLRNLGFWFPSFLFSWPMILIVIGLYTGIRERFSSNGWWIILAIGVFFLLHNELEDFRFGNFFWPLLILAIGISILLGKGGGWKKPLNLQKETSVDPVTGIEAVPKYEGDEKEEVLDAAAIFGSVKKNVYSKNFKGGEVVAVFGGTEINLMHADFTGEAKLEIVNIFGGTTLFVPAHWQIRSEAAAILGAIEDKRRETSAVQSNKVLIIEGFVLFGGIDIKSV